MSLGIFFLLIVVVAIFLYYKHTQKRKIDIVTYTLPPDSAALLEEHVHFYKQLSPKEKEEFEERIKDFLARTTITPVGKVKLEDIDRVLIASSAIIPIFYFKGWRYNNISEVLLYGNAFNKNYEVDGQNRNIAGMVGNGALNRNMILSQPALRQGFLKENSQNNTGIHEFVHLLDKADGAVDGVPEYLLGKEYIVPWLREMHEQMKEIKTVGSDINPYAATNEAEFFAVTATYFFEKPELLEVHHPELYRLLQLIFHPQVVKEV